MEYTLIEGPAESISPLRILKELDERLISQGWERLGDAPSALDSKVGEIKTTKTTALRAPIFGYQHAASGDVLRFQVMLDWSLINHSRTYNSEFQLYFEFQNTWKKKAPTKAFMCSAQYQNTVNNNAVAQWHLGVAQDGFYIAQFAGERPCGFAIERVANSDLWLTQTIGVQNTTVASLQEGVVSTVSTQTDSDAVQATVFRKYATHFSPLGGCKLLALTKHSGVDNPIQLPHGVLEQGFWYLVPGENPVRSDLVKKFWDNPPHVTQQDGDTVKVYRCFSNYASRDLTQIVWRQQ